MEADLDEMPAMFSLLDWRSLSRAERWFIGLVTVWSVAFVLHRLGLTA